MNHSPKGGALKDDWRAILALVVVALAIRLDFLYAGSWTIDSDEAIVGLMASDIAQGKGIPTFYYGQHYMGSLEPLLVSAGFQIWGVSNYVLKGVPLLFSLILVVLVYCLAHEISGKRGARIAALLCALPPSPLVVWSSMARGGFIEILVIGAGALLGTVRWLRASQPGFWRTAVIGLLLGLGWWVNNQIVYFMLPIAFVMGARLLRDENRGRRVFSWKAVLIHPLVGIFAFFAGGFPFWEYNFRHDFVSFQIFHHAEAGDLLEHLSGLFTVSLPMIFGARRFWSDVSVFPFADAVVMGLYGLLFVLLCYVRKKAFIGLLKLRVDRQQPVELFSLFALSCLAVFAFSSFGWLVEAPRYLLPLYIAIFVLCGYLLTALSNYMPVWFTAAFACCLGMNLASCYWGGRAVPGEPFVANGERVSRDDDDLIDWLSDHRVSFVRTNYWIGYRLAFETDQAVRFVRLGEPRTVRISGWELAASELDEEEIPYVLVPSQAEIIKRGLGALGRRYNEARVSGYVVLYNVRPLQDGLKKISPSRFSVKASDNPAEAKEAVDGDVHTRWGSAHPQAPGMQFTVEFPAATMVRGLKYDLGQWGVSDYPRGLLIEAELESGQKRPLVQTTDYEALRYMGARELDFCWAPFKARRIILTQSDLDAIFDWSIAELTVYE